ncbi:MAG: 2-dehydro-3-deoxy-6-phosphogalactonate aldolase [Planctomycetia bacterium]
MADRDSPLVHLAALPLIAILRGIEPDEAVAIGAALCDAGFRVIEIPLNSPRPLESIRRLAAAVGDRASVGAGTVVRLAEVAEVAAAGGTLIVAPNADPEVIRGTKAAGLVSCPGVATPTEGFAALAAGADALKLFPAEQIGPAVVKAWRAVFARHVPLLPVGGITPDTMAAYRAAGATGFGLGSALYKPGMTAAAVRRTADAFVTAWHYGATMVTAHTHPTVPVSTP